MTPKDLEPIILSEQVGVWAYVDPDSESSVIVIKAAGTAAKSISRGAAVELYLGVAGSSKLFLGGGLKIYDTHDNPLLIPIFARTESEVVGWRNIVNTDSFRVVVMDEFDAPVLRGTGYLNRVSHTLPKVLATASWISNVQALAPFIEAICNAIDPRYKHSSSMPAHVHDLELQLELKQTLIISASESGTFQYDLNDMDEGTTQEKHLHQHLHLSFGDNVFLSPQIERGKKIRELTDVLVVSKESTLFFESKALCLNDSKDESDYERRVGKVISHAKKAVGQLEGAVKSYRKTEYKVMNSMGIELPHSDSPNQTAIVVISEFVPHENWESILKLIRHAYLKSDVRIVVIDLTELMRLLKISSYRKRNLGFLLNQRFIASLEGDTLNIRSEDSSLPFNL
ncbi:MAG: hypothetical protein HLX52_03870 [Idiomarinaceae bacterium]|uniref:hypothetical protein n=1 Tax=Idiomarina sp. 28-8 TaxID=1260624 RepID=UPI0002E76875|nr:hypothetical protein [Idiomarina sp. 28-8]NWO02083.1 hypothetical protein [Idiomarinaceae bacterium]